MKPYVALLVTLLSISAAAQQPAPQKAPSSPRAEQAPSVPKPPKAPAVPAAPAPPAPHVDPEVGGQATNVRLDVSVIDQAADGSPQPRTLMVLLADRAMGRTRAAFQDRTINVDARPTITDGRVRVLLTVMSEETRSGFEPGPKDHTMNWRNSFSLLLDNAKPMIALETADAATKRKMSIEVKATILK